PSAKNSPSPNPSSNIRITGRVVPYDVMRIIRRISTKTALICTFAILGTFAAGWYTSRALTLREVGDNTARPVRYNDPNYPLISPLISVAIPNASGFPELKRVKSAVERVITAAKENGAVSDVGVYFRLPVNAHWFGV